MVFVDGCASQMGCDRDLVTWEAHEEDAPMSDVAVYLPRRIDRPSSNVMRANIRANMTSCGV